MCEFRHIFLLQRAGQIGRAVAGSASRPLLSAFGRQSWSDDAGHISSCIFFDLSQEETAAPLSVFILEPRAGSLPFVFDAISRPRWQRRSTALWCLLTVCSRLFQTVHTPIQFSPAVLPDVSSSRV